MKNELVAGELSPIALEFRFVHRFHRRFLKCHGLQLSSMNFFNTCDLCLVPVALSGFLMRSSMISAKFLM